MTINYGLWPMTMAFNGALGSCFFDGIIMFKQLKYIDL